MNFIRGLTIACCLLSAATAAAQRVQFASPVETQATTAATAQAPNVITVQTTTAPPSTFAPPANAMPAQTVAPSATYTAPGAAGVSPTAPYAPPAYGAAPYGQPAVGGAVQPTPTWDPYAAPCPANGALLSQDPYMQGGPTMSMATVQKFLQHINFEYAWFAGHGEKELGINDVELSATFAFPLFAQIEAPFLVTPGFGVQYWEGPISVLPVPADMPPRTYDAYLDVAWNPQIAPWFGAELDFCTGLFCDFTKVSGNCMRYMGKGLAVVTISPSIKMKAGVWYLDRNRVKILPAGGLIWTPNSEVYFNILFPDPKIAKRLATLGNTEWWLYGAGIYGGGNWTVKRKSGLGVPSDGTYERVDYNDIEISVGLEFKTLRHLDGRFEVGGAFSRELVYQDDSPHTWYPNNTVFIRTVLMY